MDDLEYWRSRISRDEVFSPKYKPNPQEATELAELVKHLGMDKKKLFEKEDVKWKELSAQSNILLKRGPVLCQGQEREFILLTHGFVLAQVDEPSSRNAFARIMISRTYEQCEMYNAIDHIRSVPVTVEVIVEIDDEEKEEEGVEVDEVVGVKEQVDESGEELEEACSDNDQTSSGDDDKEEQMQDIDDRKEAINCNEEIEENVNISDDEDGASSSEDDTNEKEPRELNGDGKVKDNDEGEKGVDETNDSKGEEESEGEESGSDEDDEDMEGKTKSEEKDEMVQENEAQEDIPVPVGSPGMIGILNFMSTMTKSPEKPPEKEEKHVEIETPPQKKKVTRQEERHCFVIKTESDEFYFECATKLHKEAWLEALERVLVKTRSRARSTKARERGWQHALVQTSLHSAGVTGLDDLCCDEWSDEKNKLDTYNRLSPLHYATMNNFMHIMDYLLSHGADPEVQDEDERTPMYYAQREGLTGAQVLLLDYGAKRSHLCDVEERGELFKGAAQVAEAKAAKSNSSLNGAHENRTGHVDEDLKSHQQAATKAHGAMNDAMNELRIRGDKINNLAEKTNELEQNVQTYGELAKQMKARAKKKKWYNLR